MDDKTIHRILYGFGIFLVIIGAIELYKGITQAIPQLGPSGGAVWVSFSVFFLVAGILMLLFPGWKKRREKRLAKKDGQNEETL